MIHIRNSIRIYNAYLNRQSQKLTSYKRLKLVNDVIFPWITPSFLAYFSMLILEVENHVRVFVMVPLSIMGIVGGLYAGVSVVIYGIRADSAAARNSADSD